MLRISGNTVLFLAQSAAFVSVAVAAGCGGASDDDAIALRARTFAKHPIDVPPKSAEEELLAGPPPKVWSSRPGPEGPIAYVLPVDHGIRKDSGGAGQFRARRGHGEHNGIDLLAPVGTPVQAICTGRARTGTSKSFGHWIRIVCEVPAEMAGEKGLHASVFYAHLDESDISAGGWEGVNSGQPMGSVGKSGNARGASIAPHLHFEIAIHGDEKAADQETHAGANQRNNKGADRFFRGLEANCLDATGFTSHAEMRRARRIDPFVFMTCGEANKPELRKPASGLAGKMLSWHRQYDADFDVDVGRWQPVPTL